MIRYPGCVSFGRSLRVMHIRDEPGAYGVDTNEYNCELCWGTQQRDGWLQELLNAQSAIEKRLGYASICPREICGEVHKVSDEIRLKHPIHALGRWVYTDWSTVALVYDAGDLSVTSEAAAEICTAALTIDGVVYDITDIEFDYPEEIAECYFGLQEVQAPCAVGEFEESVGCPLGGYEFRWKAYQLVDPLFVPEHPLVCTPFADTDNFVTELRYRFKRVDDTGAITLVGQCLCGQGCATIGVGVSDVTATIQDASEGIICLTGGVCNSQARVKIDYISSYRCADSPDTELEKAVVVYAIALADGSIAKPCECDNTWLDTWAKVDENTKGHIPNRFPFGTSVGGMYAMRVVNGYLEADRQFKVTVPLISRGRRKAYLSRFS